MKSIMMKKIIRVAAVLFCSAGLSAGLMMSAAAAQQDATPAGQQQGPPPGGRQGMNPQRRAERLQQRLGLTTDQTTQVAAILTASAAKMAGVRADTSLSEQDQRTQFQTLRQDQQAKIRAVLTPDQQAKYDQMLSMHRGRRGSQNGEMAPSPQQ